MKTMKTKIVALMLVVALAFTGCANVQNSIVINGDGSGSEEFVVSLEKQAFLESMSAASGVTLGDAYIKAFSASMTDSGYKVETRTIDGKEYLQMSQKETFKKGELQQAFVGDIPSYVTTDTIYFVAWTDADAKSLQQQVAEFGAKRGTDLQMPTDKIKITLTIQMPKAIVNTNGTIDPANPNKVSFNIPIDKTSTIFATTKSGVTVSTVKSTIKKLNAINAPKIKKLKANKAAKNASITLNINKVKGAKNYQIQYSTKKNFKGATSKTTKKTTYTIKKLKKGKKYYVRVRAAKVNYAGVEVYSKWTKKSVKTKKK